MGLIAERDSCAWGSAVLQVLLTLADNPLGTEMSLCWGCYARKPFQGKWGLSLYLLVLFPNMILVSLWLQTNKVFCAQAEEPSWLCFPDAAVQCWCHSSWQGQDERSVTWQQSQYLGLCCWGQHRSFCGHFSPAAAAFVLPAVSSAAPTFVGGIAELTEKSWFALYPMAGHDRLFLADCLQCLHCSIVQNSTRSLAVPESLSCPMPSTKTVCLKVNEGR